jgi:hypothetical protein
MIFSMPSLPKLYYIIIVLLVLLISSCSTNDSVSPLPIDESNANIEELSLSSDELNAAQQLALTETLSGNDAVLAFIAASQKFLAQQDYLQALWLADKTLPLVDDTLPYYHHQRLDLTLIKASSLQQLGRYTISHELLSEVKSYAQQHDILLTADYYQLLSTNLAHQNQLSQALTAKLYAFSTLSSSAFNQASINDIWQDFQGLSQWQLNLVAAEQAPYAGGWLKLTAIANKFGAKPEQLDYQLSMWQKLYKQHPASSIANQLITSKVKAIAINKIAVILPLTGNQSAAGIAIQQGILAGFANNDAKTLHFIDSNTLNWYGLTTELAMLDIEYVIGPLLKSNVDKYIYHTSQQAQSQQELFNNNMSLLDLTTDINDPDSSNFNNSNLNNINLDQSLPEATLSNKSAIAVNQLDTKLGTDFTNTDNAFSAIDSKAAIQSYLQQDEQTHLISTLLFNSPTTSSLPQSYSVLSMRPEDEAMQAASVLGAQNFKHPVILSQSNVLSKRIANAFAEQWRKTTGNTIAPVYYKNSAEMQTNIAAMLAVNKSKSRINQLNTKVSSAVISKPRNRRDVDMIYFVGSPQQARLIKPYIEVNTSEFARTIPIYASSRSHSYRAGSAISKDLKGLTFTQIPWLLKTEQDASLAALHQQLWPTRSDGLLRLFAMGFDSFNLIEHIGLMRQAPYLQHWGQTGVFKLGASNTLTRSLLWGTYINNGIETVAFE